MATDCDRYGTKLGRRFLAVRAIICSDTREAGSENLANYIECLMFKDERHLKGLFREASGLVSSRSMFVADLPAYRQLLAKGSSSVAASHLIDAVQDIVNGGQSPERLFDCMAERAVAEIDARLHTQRGYTRDKELHGKFETLKPLAVERVAARLRSRLFPASPAVASVRRRVTTAELLDLPVASVTTNVRAN